MSDQVKHTYTTEGVTYPWEGPIEYYKDDGPGKRVPEIRSSVYVKYFNMNSEEDRHEMGKIMTKIQNGVYNSLGDPIYTTPGDGHMHVTLVYEYKYACDPDYQMEQDQQEVEVSSNQTQQQQEIQDEETEKEESEEQDQQSQDSRILDGLPQDSIQMQSL